MTSYKVLKGMNYRPNGKGQETRAEPGDVVSNLPKKSIEWLERVGAIEEVKQTPSKSEEVK